MPRSDHSDDNTLVARAQLEALHDQAWRWALSCCRGDAEAAMETLHDAYVSLLDGRAKFQGRSSLKTFVFGVVRLTAKARRRRAAIRDWLLAPIDDAATLGHPPEQERTTPTPALTRALASLTQRQRTVAELVLLHNCTVSEAADILGLTRGAASRHYARAKDHLRAALNPAGAQP